MVFFNKEQCLEIYKKLKLIRCFEENALKLGDAGEIHGSLHLYIGQEAIAVGVCFALDKSDLITSTHRGHGHLIAKGGNIKYMFSELMGRENGYNKGKGGSMHIAEPDLGMLGANGIVGAGLPIALGAGFASKYKKDKKVVVAFFGDGALGTGTSHEAMNMAAIWKSPVIFVCENNKYALSLSVEEACPLKKVSDRAKAYNFPGITVDGMNVEEVYNSAVEAIKRARDGEGPTLIECITYRYRDHSIGVEKLGLKYRTKVEIDYWKSRCPIEYWKNRLLREEIGSEDELMEIDNHINDEILKAIEFARASALPKPEDALNDMYTDEYENIPDRGWLQE